MATEPVVVKSFTGDCSHAAWKIIGYYQDGQVVPLGNVSVPGKPDLSIQCAVCTTLVRFNQKLNCARCFVPRQAVEEGSCTETKCPECASSFDFARPDNPFPWETS